MAKPKYELTFMAAFPWMIGGILLWQAPELILPSLRDSHNWPIIGALLLWEGLGLLVAKSFRDDDPELRFKMVFVMALFFFPIVFVIILGPLANHLARAFRF